MVYSFNPLSKHELAPTASSQQVVYFRDASLKPMKILNDKFSKKGYTTEDL